MAAIPVPAWWHQPLGDYHRAADGWRDVFKGDTDRELKRRSDEYRAAFDTTANVKLHALLPILGDVQDRLDELLDDPTLEGFGETYDAVAVPDWLRALRTVLGQLLCECQATHKPTADFLAGVGADEPHVTE